MLNRNPAMHQSFAIGSSSAMAPGAARSSCPSLICTGSQSTRNNGIVALANFFLGRRTNCIACDSSEGLWRFGEGDERSVRASWPSCSCRRKLPSVALSDKMGRRDVVSQVAGRFARTGSAEVHVLVAQLAVGKASEYGGNVLYLRAGSEDAFGPMR